MLQNNIKSIKPIIPDSNKIVGYNDSIDLFNPAILNPEGPKPIILRTISAFLYS